MKTSSAYFLAAGLITAMPFSNTWAQDAGLQLEEIIVTAEKQEADLQKTAIAITALDADSLTEAGVSRPEELSKLVPGLNIAQGGPSTQVYVRGVGNYGTNAFADPAVAFNMDGVYISRFSGIAGNFYDIQRVEVLKGPQGTLYGRNATGGAINIVTNKPEKNFAGGVGLEMGNYNLFKANGFINVPVADSFALRFAAQKTDRDGYQTDGNDDDVSRGARLSALFDPSDAFSLLVTGSYLHIGGKGPAEVPVTNNGFYDNSNPWVGQSIALPVVLSQVASPPGAVLFTGVDYTSGHQSITVKSITAEANASLGIADLTVQGNHSTNDNPSKYFGPGFLVDAREKSRQNSLEARLAGKSDAMRWVFGLYHFDEKQSSNYWVDQGFLFNQTGMDMRALKDDTNAAFTQLTYNLTDALHLTGGLRYTQEKKSQDGNIYGRQPQTSTCAAAGTTAVNGAAVAAAIPQAATNGAGASYPFVYCSDTLSGSTKWNDTSWKAGIDYDVTDSSMVYASVSRGFKAGGYYSGGDHSDVTLPDGTHKIGNRFDPETLIAYAVGSKNRFFDNRLQLNGEAFYWDYKDHQENYLAPTSSAGTFNFVTQQADARIYGLDLEADALLSDYDTLGVKLQYLHAEYTDATFINASPGVGNPSPRSQCSMKQSDTTLTIWYADCNGQQMPRSPTLSGTLDYNHVFKLANGGGVVPGVNVQYSSSYWSAVDYNPLQKQDAYTMYGADLAYKAPEDAWSITAYGANLGNEVIYSNAFMYPGTNSVTTGGSNNVANVALRAPRTYGVRFSAKF